MMIYMFIIYLIIGIFKIIFFILPNIRRIKDNKNIRYLSSKIEKGFNIVFYLSEITIMINEMFKVVNNIFISLIVVAAIFACILLSINLGYLIIGRFGNNKNTKIISGIVTGIIMFVFIMAFIYGTITCVVRLDLPSYKNEKKYTYTTSNNKKRIRVLRQDTIPFNFKDLVVSNSKAKYFGRHCNERATIFVKISECSEIIFDDKLKQLDGGIYYEILDTDFEFIKKSYINKMIDSEDYYGYKKDKNEAKRWHAKEVYKLTTFSDSSDNELYDILVVYKDKVFFYKYYCEDYFKDNTDIVYKKILKW